MLEFQSLVGFKINWNFESGTDLIGYQMFQSLVGFKINWNSRYTSV
ncbi:diguanylate cyclase/phosphodiesterase (GGDEF & EAL domains) with PAS/PAC sensor(s) [Microcystis aeruginosa NIES-98]|nr:diguanylate cyclase/phosphodiesterase (GGDEF & EAL domains) with PAS/PAC sensor(s) [Microcystis aeruginosa NIES-98]